MFRHQTHPRNVHPYQTTIVPRTDAQFQNSTQQRMKYPWLENPPFQPPPEYLSTNSSASENYQVAHHYTNVPPHTHWTTRSQSDGLSSPVYHTPHGEDDHRLSPSLLGVYSKPYQPGVEIPTYTLPLGVQESGSSAGECCESGRGASPAAVARSPVPSEAPGGCGGHCPGFQYVCYYVLQIIFVVGILTGISLCIAGSVLRRSNRGGDLGVLVYIVGILTGISLCIAGSVLRRSNRGGDLGVLVYIGCLASMVCSLLLGVQCCVRRNNKQRGKQLRMRTAAPDCIQLDTIPNLALDERDGGGHSLTMQHSGPGQTVAARQLQPLLFPTGTFLTSTATFPRDYYRSSQRYMQPSPTEELNGVPWWRRQQHQ